MPLILILIGLGMMYAVVTLVLTAVVHRVPRSPVVDPPDWGRCLDARIPADGGGYLNVWRVEPEGESRGIILLAHGWGRNRDRMTRRARMFGNWGYTTVFHSARDHGGSSRKWFMNAPAFARDIESVLDWLGESVILYGHSMGAAGAIIAARRRQTQIQLLFLEGCYARTREALLSLYRWANRFFGVCLAPAVLWWMDIFYRGPFSMDAVNPVRLAPEITVPVMLIHGECDRRFPLSFTQELRHAFPNGPVPLYVAKGAGHSDSSRTPGYPEAICEFLCRNGFSCQKRQRDP